MENTKVNLCPKNWKEIEYLPDLFKDNEEGENTGEIYERAKEFLDKISHKHKNDVVLFVSHNMFNQALMTVIFNKPKDWIGKGEKQYNTAVSVFDIYEDKNHKIHLYNDINHLK